MSVRFRRRNASLPPRAGAHPSRYGGTVDNLSAAPDISPTPLVQARSRGSLGHLRLNRPAKINALNLEMIAAVRSALARWRDDPAVTAVLIDGAGPRGLCAGGDIAAVYDGIRGGSGFPDEFWADEYRMNLDIAEYRKPIVALMHGITFGGGLGISAHASIRVVTDSSVLAMPETAIGLAPDVGGLHLLARAPGELGTHAALTGARLGPGDAIAAGLADLYLDAADLATLPDSLVSALESGGSATTFVHGLARPAPAAELWPSQQPWIDDCYAGDDPIAILARLRGHDEPEARAAADVLAAMSPIAVAVTLRAIRRARTMTLAEVLDQDLTLSVRFAAHHDFPEGIRAQITDKDRRPRWNPPTLDLVTPAAVDAFFAPRG